MENFKGILAINEKCDYRIYGDGKCINFRELFDKESLNNKVEIKIIHNGEVVFNKKGILSRIKSYEVGQVYKYFVDEENLDDILWGLVDKKLEITFRDFGVDKLEISKEENKAYPKVTNDLIKEIKTDNSNKNDINEIEFDNYIKINNNNTNNDESVEV